jgi:hypothetical protein
MNFLGLPIGFAGSPIIATAGNPFFGVDAFKCGWRPNPHNQQQGHDHPEKSCGDQLRQGTSKTPRTMTSRRIATIATSTVTPIGLFGFLAIVMFLTRRIDWFNPGNSRPSLDVADRVD